ncbi:MAG TPA: TetR/AcrR family transcriptional regulator, partial [Acidimicrobiales bacterium]
MPTSASTPTRRRWAGIPAEDRRAARRVQLVDAAFDLLGSGGEAAVTVRAVCRHARLNPRYFYESFDDLDALLIAVYERTVTELTTHVLAAM